MQSLSLTLWAVVVMVVLVALTLVRSMTERRTKSRLQRLESALDRSLATGEIHPGLHRLDDRDTDLLALLMIDYLSVLRGAERERLAALA